MTGARRKGRPYTLSIYPAPSPTVPLPVRNEADWPNHNELMERSTPGTGLQGVLGRFALAAVNPVHQIS